MRARAVGAEVTKRLLSAMMEGAVVLMSSFRGGNRSELYGTRDDDDDEDEDDDEELLDDDDDDEEEAEADAEEDPDPPSTGSVVATDG